MRTTLPTLNGLGIRRELGRDNWTVPQLFGPDGWMIDARSGDGRIITTCCDFDGVEWIHASISRGDRMPDYEDLKLLHRAIFGARWAYQVFAPPADHVNIHQHVLHLWGRVDGEPSLPNFGQFGTI